MCKHLTLVPIAEETPSLAALAAVISTGLRRSAIDGRNLDGTGIGYIHNGKFIVHKTGSNAVWHTNTDEFVDTLRGINLMAQPVIGHVRSASQTFRTTLSEDTRKFPDKDAHPFVVGNIMLTHNGTISNHQVLVAEKGLDEGNIDSYAIAELLAREGRKNLDIDALNKVTKELQGSFALIIQHLHHPQQVILVRHNKPLFLVKVFSYADEDVLEFIIVTTDDDNATDALSTVQHINRYIMGRRLWGAVKIEKLDEDMWYVLDRDIMRDEGKILKLGPMKWKRHVAAASRVVTTGANGRTSYRNTVSHPWGNTTSANARLIGKRMAAIIGEALDVLPLTVEEFRYFYTMLNEVEPTAEMHINTVRSTVDYLKYLLLDDGRMYILAQFMDMELTPRGDGFVRITRQNAVTDLVVVPDDGSNDVEEFEL